jgi:methionine-rich copper-binding protein CopC
MTHRIRTASIGALTAAIAAVAVAVLPVASASAHDYLVGSDPAADAVVSAPLDAVKLTFNDRVLDIGGNSALVTVTGPDAATRHFETGCATIADTVVSAPVALGAAGKYTITYQIVSADGHQVSNSYAFSYQPPSGTAEAAGTEKTACGASTSTPSAEPTTSATQPAAAEPTETAGSPQPTAAASTDIGLVIGIAVAIVVLAIIAVVIVLLTARRKPKPGPGPGPTPDE